MTLECLIEKYIEKTGYGMDMWSKEENAVMTAIAEIIAMKDIDEIIGENEPYPKPSIKISRNRSKMVRG